MKRNYFLKQIALILFIVASFHLVSQSASSNTFNVTQCGCPGEVWNFSIPTKPYIFFPAANNSKRCMYTNYGFNVPATSTITGVQVDFTYYCAIPPANKLKDSTCKLLLNGTLISEDKAPQTNLYGNSGSSTFGGPGDMWLAPYISPAIINDPTFGFNFQLYASGGNVDFNFNSAVVITVYYNLASGISEWQRSSTGIKAFYNSGHLEINLDVAEKTDLEIFDLSGKKIHSSSFEFNTKNSADLSFLQKGIYNYHINTPTESKVARFVIE